MNKLEKLLLNYIVHVQYKHIDISYGSLRSFAFDKFYDMKLDESEAFNMIEPFVEYCLSKGLECNPAYGQIRSYLYFISNK